MHGHIFGCNEEQGDRRQHLKTVAALQQCTTKLPFSEDFQCLFKATPTLPTLSEPEPPIAEDKSGITDLQDLIFKEEIKQFVSQRMKLRSNLVAIWNIILGQCTDTMKAKLESNASFEDRESSRDCAWLLTTILAITPHFDNRRYRINTLLEAYQKFFTCRQSSTQTVDDYRQALTTWADIIDHHGGTLVFTEPTSTNIPAPTGKKASKEPSAEQQKEASRQATLAMTFLRNSDSYRYGTLLTELANSYAAGRDQYPKDLLTAYSLLLEYKTPYAQRPRQQDHRDRPDPANNRQPPKNSNSTTTTANTTPTSSVAGSTTPSATTDNRPPSTIRAAPTFAQAVQPSPPPATTTPAPQGTTLAQWAAIMAQHTGSQHTIDPSWVLLDSQSTMSVFHNKQSNADQHPPCAQPHMCSHQRWLTNINLCR
jgi:hypothetical protein